MAWWEDAHFPARARRAALPRPGRPKNHLQENLRILPPLSHFGGSIAQKRRAVKKNRGPGGAGMQTGGAYHPAARACRDAPTGGLQAAPTHNGKGPNLLRRGVFSRRFPGGVKTPPYKPPQTRPFVFHVLVDRRGGMYAARKVFLRQRGFASRQPIFGCTVGRGLDPAVRVLLPARFRAVETPAGGLQAAPTSNGRPQKHP